MGLERIRDWTASENVLTKRYSFANVLSTFTRQEVYKTCSFAVVSEAWEGRELAA